MNKFKQNIVNIFGSKGNEWITALPSVIKNLATLWNLHDITPVKNMTFHYVAKAITHTHQPVILKIGYDQKSIENEKQALIYFNGDGSIKLIDHTEKYHALLLQQAIPGITLTSFYPDQIDLVIDCYTSTMKKLHSKHLPSNHNYPHIREWLQAIDKLTPNHHISESLLKNVVSLKNQLLKTITTEVFLHGDLHHDNMLKHHDEWLAIDPKGVIGETEFEIAAFDFMYVNELANDIHVKNTFETRINLLAKKAGLDAQRIKDWILVRLVLMAAWNIEDNLSPDSAIKLAEALMQQFPLTS